MLIQTHIILYTHIFQVLHTDSSSQSMFSAMFVLNFTVYQPPVITGDTTVNEGSTLSLNCDSSNSNQQPPVTWFYQTNDVSNTAQLTLPDIMRSQAGNYTCQTSPPNRDNSRSSSVDVVVQCMNYRFTLLHTSTVLGMTLCTHHENKCHRVDIN